MENKKANEILKRVQKMYRTKKFQLDESAENILECEFYSYERSGEYDSYTESGYNKKHFCTIEFADRLLPKILIQKQRRINKPKSKLKIFGKLINPQQ